MKTFVKSSELSLVNGGYLTAKTEFGSKPVGNAEFVKAQERAQYIMTFAKLAKGKDFVGKKADSLADLQAAVAAALSTKATKYVDVPSEPKRPTTEKLAAEAMAFINFGKDKTKAEKINNFLQQFNVLAEFEDFGLFFDDEIVKLDKIYTMKEIIEAVTETIDLLG